jgi:hypothetical protein
MGPFQTQKEHPTEWLAPVPGHKAGPPLARAAHMVRMAVSTVVLASLLNGCGHVRSAVLQSGTAATAPVRKGDGRAAAIARAQVWTPTKVAAMDIVAGPRVTGAFPFRATVTCDHVNRTLGGASPKFACLIGADDEVKVKFGGANAEVYGEVAATRLLWALGFGADRMYPVRVVCRGCPPQFAGIARGNDQWLFDPAVIERKMNGAEFPRNSGWSFQELDGIDAKAGGAPRAHVDALKLLAVFMQHTDTKPEQQRLVCLGEDDDEDEDIECSRPFMMLQDVGLTFGKANAFNANQKAMHLAEWAATPVWKDPKTCVGNLPKSLKGTLDNPAISEAGRAFLAGLLTQLSDRQIRDLFEVSRVTLRLRAPENARSGFPTVDEWVNAFKQKRNEIVDHRCA